MNQYRDFGPLDDRVMPVGDRQFERLDMRSDATVLREGAVARSENFRFEETGARVRAGIARQLTAGDTVETIYCAGVYRPDNDNDRLALVNGSRLTLFDPATQTTARYNFPVGEEVTEDDGAELIQGGVSSGTTPDLYILRGFAKTVLKFDGTSVAVNASFKQSSTGIFVGDRMGVISSAWEINASDLLDFTTWSALAQFQISRGSDDYLVHLRAYQKEYVLIGARKRWFIAHFDAKVSATVGAGQSGGVEDTSFLRDLTREAGVVGKRAAHETNGKIWFVSDRGIYAFVPQLGLELTVLGKPISTPIQPILDRLSADYAQLSSIEHSGYRVYVAMPISGEVVRVSTAAAGAETVGLELPFDLPAILGGGYTVTVTTAAAHDLSTGDLVRVKGCVDTNLNGTRRVTSVVSSTVFTLEVDDTNGLGAGERATVQRVAERPNAIAVFNTALDAWESIDFLPEGMFADYLVVADADGQRRLWLVDADLGPCLYEEGEADEITDQLGGLSLPFDLPGELSVANFGSVPVAGYLKSRTYQWGGETREVKAGSARLQLGGDDAGTVTVTVRTPNRATEWTATKDFDGLTLSDRNVRKRCGRRGIEAEVEVTTTAGRPAVRSLVVEINNTGRDKED
jgi:hypothetical protein